MMKTKDMVLVIVGVLIALMGVMSLIQFPYKAPVFAEPSWHAMLKILIGVVAIYFGMKKD